MALTEREIREKHARVGVFAPDLDRAVIDGERDGFVKIFARQARGSLAAATPSPPTPERSRSYLRCEKVSSQPSSPAPPTPTPRSPRAWRAPPTASAKNLPGGRATQASAPTSPGAASKTSGVNYRRGVRSVVTSMLETTDPTPRRVTHEAFDRAREREPSGSEALPGAIRSPQAAGTLGLPVVRRHFVGAVREGLKLIVTK